MTEYTFKITKVTIRRVSNTPYHNGYNVVWCILEFSPNSPKQEIVIRWYDNKKSQPFSCFNFYPKTTDSHYKQAIEYYSFYVKLLEMSFEDASAYVKSYVKE